MAILVSADYVQVRAALDLSLESGVLPDSVIGANIFQGKAERRILAHDPLAESRTGEELNRVKAAAVYLIAALIAPSIPNLTGEKLGDQQYSREAVDWAARAKELERLAWEELRAVVPLDGNSYLTPHVFTVLRGDRGA